MDNEKQSVTRLEKRKLLKGEIREALLEELDYTREISEEELFERIDEKIWSYSKAYAMDLEDRKILRQELFYGLRQLDILQELLNDREITEIMINGPDHIFLEKKGRLTLWENKFESSEKLEHVIQQIVSGCNRTVNESSPIVDARLENGARVNVVLRPIALNGPIVTIRQFPDQPFRMEDLIRKNTLSEEMADLLKKLVVSGYNILISGGTGSGKTTFLNALSDYIPCTERIITIEDSAELQLINRPNLVRLETRNANVEGCREITIRDLIKTALRMRPDRIVVGEVRGAEAIDLLQAYNTGHDGSLSTAHANSAQDMITRLETMVLMGMEIPLVAIRGQIASAIDIIVHLGRIRDKSRKVLEITELGGDGSEIKMNTLFAFDYGLNTWIEKGELIKREKFVAAGIIS